MWECDCSSFVRDPLDVSQVTLAGESLCTKKKPRTSGICEHNRERHMCKDCGGAGICEHNRRRSKCKDCGGACADVYEATVNILHRNWKPPRFFLVLYVYEVFAFAKKRKNSLLCYYSLPSPSLEPSLLFAKAGWVCHTDT